MRTDFNVPLERDGDTVTITDDFRIRAALPTIEWLRERGATVVTASHLGRPKGKPDPKYSMDAVRNRLGELAPGVELLENLRYDPGEEGNDDAFARKLVDGDRRLRQRRVRRVAPRPRQHRRARRGTCRARPAACCSARSRCCSACATSRRRPFVAVLGGAKVSDKLGVIDALLETVDALAIGGAMCFTFLAAQGNPIGDSLFEPDQVETCRRILATTAKPIHLPSDIVGLDASGTVQTFGTRLPDGAKGLDIGPGSAAAFGDVVMDARTVFWNGPMGMFEDERFAMGTRAVAQAWPTPRRSRSSAAVTPRRRSPSSASPTTSTTCRPAAAPRSSCSSSATSRDSPRCARRPPVAEARRPLISGNWKMHLNHFEALQTVQKLGYLLPKEAIEHVDVSIHPPFTDIRTVQTSIDADRLPFLLGAQHCHWEDTGAFTGEVSPAFLAKLEVKYVICGHSERRELFGETDEMVAAKAAAILRHGMTPIICVGETLEEREAGETETKVARPGAGGARRPTEGERRRARHRLRADLGDRHRSHGDRRRRPDGLRSDPRARSSRSPTRRPRRPCGSSTAAR